MVKKCRKLRGARSLADPPGCGVWIPPPGIGPFEDAGLDLLSPSPSVGLVAESSALRRAVSKADLYLIAALTAAGGPRLVVAMSKS